MSDARETILLIDDERELAENIAEILEGEGFETLIATSPSEALEVARTRRVSGVVVDYKLPELCGVDVIWELRRTGCEAAVVMVTAFSDPDIAAEAEAAGALDVLCKPVDIARLVDLVRRFRRDAAHILVVEDNEELAENVADALSDAGFSAQVRPTQAGALGDRTLPKVAIVDIRLPDGDGLQLVERLAARDPRIRIVLMTAYPTDLDALKSSVRARLQGPVLHKPVDVAELIALVGGAIQE